MASSFVISTPVNGLFVYVGPGSSVSSTNTLVNWAGGFTALLPSAVNFVYFDPDAAAISSVSDPTLGVGLLVGIVAASSTGSTRIIQEFLLSSTTIQASLTSVGSAQTIAALRLKTNVPQNYAPVIVLGGSTPGDGGGGTYYFDPTSTATDNSGTIIKQTSITTGRFIKCA